MSAADLEEIRKARLAQLQQGSDASGVNRKPNEEDERKQQESEARSSILSQILTPEAADRLGRIRLVKEARAIDIENRLIMLGRSGQLRSKVTEDQLKEILSAVAENGEKGSGGSGGRIVITRRKGNWEDDDSMLGF